MKGDAVVRIFGRPKVKRPRQLSSCTRVAEKPYDCHGCHHGIQPGELYDYYVSVFERKILVSRWHHPCCPWDPEEERELMEDTEVEEKESQTKKSVHKIAA